MSEKETLSKIIAKYAKTLPKHTSEVQSMEGEIKGIESSGTIAEPSPYLIPQILGRVNVRDERTIAFLNALISWIQRVEDQSSEN